MHSFSCISQFQLWYPSDSFALCCSSIRWLWTRSLGFSFCIIFWIFSTHHHSSHYNRLLRWRTSSCTSSPSSLSFLVFGQFFDKLIKLLSQSFNSILCVYSQIFWIFKLAPIYIFSLYKLALLDKLSQLLVILLYLLAFHSFPQYSLLINATTI
jgi:hypothetical protein